MSFDSEIVKTELSALPELYDFESGGAVIGRYTSYLKSITFRGLVYTPAPIKRGDIGTDASFSAPGVTITAPVLESFVHYIASQPRSPVKVTIYRVIEMDTGSFVTLFKGRIKTVAIQDRIVSALCEGGSHILTSRFPDTLFQSGCNHAVFDEGCGLSKEAWGEQGTVTAVSGASVFSPLFAGNAGFYAGGILTFGDSASQITGHPDGHVTLHTPVAGLSAGSAITVYPGCDGTPATCKTRYNNFDHFLGFTCIPSSNPVIWGL
jgi:uncharacterized phage protein (TIGR02218 family)